MSQKKKQIRRDEIIERRINDIHIVVLYKCLENETYCDIDEKDKRAFYQLLIYYQGFLVNPRSTIPIIKQGKNIFHNDIFNFN